MNKQESKQERIGSRQEQTERVGYRKPAVEKRVTADELEREAKYAGVLSGT